MPSPISFVEAMRGWLRSADGDELPVSFELVALRMHHARFEVRGVIAAPPLVRETPARGTLELGLSRLAYHLDFVGADGQPLHLDAVKHPSLRSPVLSMTRMQARILDASGTTVASGEMRFALEDLPDFVLSWLPGSQSRHGQRQLETRRRGLERRALTAPEGVMR